MRRRPITDTTTRRRCIKGEVTISVAGPGCIEIGFIGACIRVVFGYVRLLGLWKGSLLGALSGSVWGRVGRRAFEVCEAFHP